MVGCCCGGSIPRSKLLLLVCWVGLCVLLTRPCQAANGDTAIIKQLAAGQHDTQLLQAFSNPHITRIILASDYAVGSQFDKYAGTFQEPGPTVFVER